MKTYSPLIIIIVTFCCFTYSCKVEKGFSFDLENQDQLITLSRNIKDVAGITIDTSRTIWAINESDPLIFAIDALSKKTINQITIANDADYRGITFLNGYVYVTRKDGFLKRIAVDKNKTVKTYFNPIKDVTDIGGMDYDSSRNSLLLVHNIRSNATTIDIYNFDLEESRFDEEVVISIPLDLIKNRITSTKDSNTSLQPSGIAVDPVSHHIYITLGNQFIVETNHDGDLITVDSFPEIIKGVATGICFNKNGELMVAFKNEDSKAMIYTYKRR